MCIIIWMGRNVGWKFQYYFTVEKLKGLGCFVSNINVILASILLARQSHYFLMFYSCQKIERMGMCMNFNVLDVRED